MSPVKLKIVDVVAIVFVNSFARSSLFWAKMRTWHFCLGTGSIASSFLPSVKTILNDSLMLLSLYLK